MWGINLNPLIEEIKKLPLSQTTIINLLQLQNNSLSRTNSLLQEQNELLKKILEQK